MKCACMVHSVLLLIEIFVIEMVKWKKGLSAQFFCPFVSKVRFFFFVLLLLPTSFFFLPHLPSPFFFLRLLSSVYRFNMHTALRIFHVYCETYIYLIPSGLNILLLDYVYHIPSDLNILLDDAHNIPSGLNIILLDAVHHIPCLFSRCVVYLWPLWI